MNRDERIYSVTMTENELRLFSEFLEQREFENKDYDYYTFHSKSLEVDDFVPGVNRLSKEVYESPHESIYRRYWKTPEDYGLDRDAYFRTKEARNKLLSNERLKKKNPAQYDLEEWWSGEALKAREDEVRRQIAKRDGRVPKMIEKENKLHESGYDDKYSSKFMENLTKRSRTKEAHTLNGDKTRGGRQDEILNRRLMLDSKYKDQDSENPIDSTGFSGKVKESFRDTGRKLNDASMVYNVSTDGRSLGKDAAIAAGVTAGLVGGGIALRKHLKKKKQEKELAENKYKTSDEGKKDKEKKKKK